MKKSFPAWTTVALAIAVPMWLAAAPAAAQSKGGTATSGATSSGGSASAGGGGHASSGGSSGGGGGHASGGGGVSSGGGSHVSAGSSGTRVSSGGSGASHGSNGNSGSAASRGAVQRGPGSSPTSANSAARTGAATNDSATPRGGSRTNDANGVSGNVPPNARPRNGQPSIGTAVPRTSTTPILGQGNVFVPGLYGYYPYGYGGLGFIGGYYGGYYGDYAGGYGGGYGAGYGGYDDQYDQGYQSAPARSDDAGGLKLKIRPAEAAVYVDGYYVGVVGDFDGVFQKLTIEPGAHRVEVRANGYETLTFEVRIEDGHTTTYRGEMKKLP